MRLFPDEFTGTLPQETLDGGFREANPLADTYRFGGGKRGRQEGKQFGVPLVQHSDFHFWRYAAFHGTEVFRQPDGTVGAFFVNLVHVGFSTDTAHDLNDQTEADEVGFQFSAEGFLRLFTSFFHLIKHCLAACEKKSSREFAFPSCPAGG